MLTLMAKHPSPAAVEDEDPGAKAMQVAAGRRIAAVRRLSHVTQIQLAELLGVDQSTVGKWETGERMVSPHKMAVFCARFRVSMDFIFRGRLESVDPAIALALAQKHPGLVLLPPIDTAKNMGTAQL